MASLTHVCMWHENGWKRISAEEATGLHPGGTVSARSGLFMCELCGQYVILTDGDINVRYFRHSAYEKSKDCPERTFGAGYSISYKAEEHELPIRITEISSSSFRFEIGFVRAPISSLSKDFRIMIQPKGTRNAPFVFSKERFSNDSITYLPLGEQPYEKYTLNIQNGSDKLAEFWPPEINGVDPEGTLFEKSTGRKMPHDADVEIGKEYYLLKRGYLYHRGSSDGIGIQEIVQKQFSWETWNLYIVTASDFTESAARFYLDFHCRLTEHPVSLKPVWPLFVEGSYVLKHNRNSVYMLVSGNATNVKAFPTTTIRPLSYGASQARLYEIYYSGRQQLISTGRTRALQYTYFWREPLNQAGEIPIVTITGLSGEEIPCGEVDSLPNDKTIRIESSFDGEIVISDSRQVVERRKMFADKLAEVSNLAYGTRIQVIIGLDCIWETHFQKQEGSTQNDDSELLQHITSVSGVRIPVPHSLRNILIGMEHHPLISRWIRGCIKEGVIGEQSYRRLQEAYREVNSN